MERRHQLMSNAAFGLMEASERKPIGGRWIVKDYLFFTGGKAISLRPFPASSSESDSTSVNSSAMSCRKNVLARDSISADNPPTVGFSNSTRNGRSISRAGTYRAMACSLP